MFIINIKGIKRKLFMIHRSCRLILQNNIKTYFHFRKIAESSKKVILYYKLKEFFLETM